jgi:RimJ/RimL family protein N-acetyltransferase
MCYYFDMEPRLSLREVISEDLPTFFVHLKDPDSVYMAAFVFGNPEDREAFDSRWQRLTDNPEVCIRTIEWQGETAGHVASFTMEGDREITYWIGRDYWGRGLATKALRLFLNIETERPLHARAAADNLASLRVLVKCGFRPLRTERSEAPARGEVIDEVVLLLD